MTLPVTLADTPALPRAAEPAVAGPTAGDGGAAFAETLAGAMGPASADKQADQAAAGVAGETKVDGSALTDTEAMLADLEQRAVAVEGEVLVEMAAPPPEEGTEIAAQPGPDMPGMGDTKSLPPQPDGTEAGVFLGGDGTDGLDETGGEAETAEEAATEDIPLTLPLTALLAAALPPAPATEGAAPPVQPSDAAVEAARRAMAATMTVPGLVKTEKAAKGPLEGPDAPEPAAEGEMAKAEEPDQAPARGAAAPELRGMVPALAQVTAEPRLAAEVRREAVAELALAAVEGEAGQAAPTAASGTGLAAQTGGLAVLPGAGGPIQTTRPGWEGVLADRIAAELSGDGKEIELDLAPETLGHLKIRLEVSDGLAQVRIVTETAEAARLFQQSEHRLSESLSRAGLSLGGQDTSSRDAQGGAAQGFAGQGGNGTGERGGRTRGMELHFDRQGNAALPELAGRAGRGLVNLIA